MRFAAWVRSPPAGWSRTSQAGGRCERPAPPWQAERRDEAPGASASFGSPTKTSARTSIPFWRGFALSCVCPSSETPGPLTTSPLPTPKAPPIANFGRRRVVGRADCLARRRHVTFRCDGRRRSPGAGGGSTPGRTGSLEGLPWLSVTRTTFAIRFWIRSSPAGPSRSRCRNTSSPRRKAWPRTSSRWFRTSSSWTETPARTWPPSARHGRSPRSTRSWTSPSTRT